MIIIQIIQWLTEVFSGTSINLSFNSGLFDVVSGIISFIGYVLPLDAIAVCVSVSVVLIGVRVVVAIWKLLPLT